MVSQKKKWITAASVGVLAAGGWLTYSLLAKQGQGVLAQAPLNIQASVPPAFLMALDDSGSMFWEVQNNTRDGVFRWVSSSTGRGFFDSNGNPYGYTGNGLLYYYVTPVYGRDTGRDPLPPLDAFGFARSPDINPAYFDPRDTYPDWKTGLKAKPSYMTIDPKSAPVDPRPDNAVSKIKLFKNLTDTDYSTDTGWTFVFQPEMVIPVGTLVRDGVCNVNSGRGGNATSSDVRNFVKVTTAVRVTSRCSTNVAYYPATFYLKTKLPASYGYTADPVEITKPTGGYPGTLYKYEIRQENFGPKGADTAAYTLAMQNFANWFSFYRTRRDALIGAATNALHDPENLRVGWFRINDRKSATMYKMWDEQQKAALLTDIMVKMRATSTTPNRSAAEFLGTQFKRTVSSSDKDPPVLLSCQKNAGMLFTDGFINEEGNKTRMRASIAQYYDNSLVPGIESNSVPIPKECPDGKLDCKTSLHMNFYGVTLGTLGEQFGVTYVPEPKRPWVLNPNPYETPPKFGTSTVDNAPGAVDELWEAVLYTHGEMVNATKASDITSAMRRIINNVSKGATPSGTRSLTGARIGNGSIAVEPFYEATNNGADWYSTLTAYKLSVDPATRAVVSDVAWEAASKMPTPTARKVWLAKDGVVKRFSSDNVTRADLCSKPAGLYGDMKKCGAASTLADDATAVSYLLGDTTQEVRFQGKLRDRTTVLGDIINSTPVLSSPIDDYGYRRLGNVGDSYVEYLSAKRLNRRYMVYAGANDGMLHAFDGGMGAAGQQDANGGREVFGYIPATALGHMGNLLVPYDQSAAEEVAFDHRYFVDGPVVVGDIYDTAWKTALVGTTGAGGRSVFALDVSDPTAFNESSRIWELNDFDMALDPKIRENIGHVLGKPVIVPVKGANGTVSFKAIFGNGVESKNGKAALFVVDLVAGKKPSAPYIVEESGDNLPAGRNGLMNIVVVDRWTGDDQNVPGRDGFADTVYGADQKGAIWKFDLTGTAAPEVPLFTTKTAVDTDKLTYRQPIMGGLTATAGPAGGVMLLFGTGSFSYVEDGVDVTPQGLYGVNDTSGKVVAAGKTLTAANLRPITVGTGTDGRTITMGAIPTGNAGWTVILPAGERFVANPTVTSGVVFMPTYVPTKGKSGGCTVDGSNWLFGLNTGTGTAALSQVRLGSPDGKNPATGTAALPLSTGGNAPVRDVTTSVVPRLAAPEKSGTNAPPTPPGTACMMQVSVAGAPPMYLPYPCGRQSWRQIK
ncbi:PilC/PilY family type IV pilus protein [Stenotrophomonas bentonitica]